jgi:hypothetical protein
MGNEDFRRGIRGQAFFAYRDRMQVRLLQHQRH